MFLIVILGATDERSPGGSAPLALGLAPTLLWLFWVAPLLGAALAGLGGRWLFTHRGDDQSPGPISDTPVEMIVGADRANDEVARTCGGCCGARPYHRPPRPR